MVGASNQKRESVLMKSTTKAFVLGVILTAVMCTSGIALASNGYFKDSGWWTSAAEWTKDQGLMTGIQDNYFGGDQPVTRGQLAQVLKNLSDTGAITINKPGSPAATPTPGPSQQPTTQPTPASSGVKTFNVDTTINSGPMTMHITKVTLDPAFKPEYQAAYKAIILNVSVENTSTDTVNWFPDQSTLVTNTKEQLNSSFDSDQVGGEFVGNVVKTGKIVFKTQSDLNAISSLTYKIDGPFKTIGDNVGATQTVNITLK
jgi:hypothetical protein